MTHPFSFFTKGLFFYGCSDYCGPGFRESEISSFAHLYMFTKVELSLLFSAGHRGCRGLEVIMQLWGESLWPRGAGPLWKIPP